MTAQELFRTIDFNGKGIVSYPDGSILSRNDLSFLLKGGYFVFGASNEGEVSGLPLEEIGKIKKSIATWAKTKVGLKLRCVVQNVDSRAERFALLVESTFAGMDQPLTGVPESAESSFGSFLSFVHKVGLTSLNRGALLTHLTELASDSSLSKGFSLFCDESQRLVTVLCKVYQRQGVDSMVLDAEEIFGSLSTLAFKSYLFLERNSLIEDDRRSYPKTAFFLAFAFCLSHLDMSAPKQIEIRLFPNRAELVCPGFLDEGDFEKDINQGIAEGFLLSGLPSEKLLPLFGGYSSVPEGYAPSFVLGPNTFKLRLMDLIYRPKEEKSFVPVDGSLSEEQKKVLKILSFGPRPLSSLMKQSPYKSRAAYAKFVINPLLQRKRIARVGKLTSPKAVLCIVDE